MNGNNETGQEMILSKGSVTHAGTRVRVVKFWSPSLLLDCKWREFKETRSTISMERERRPLEGLLGTRGHWLPKTPGAQPEQMVEKATALSWWKITSETLELPYISAQGCGKNQSKYEEAFIDQLDCYKTILILASNTNVLFLTLWRQKSLRSHCLHGVWLLRDFSSALWIISSPVPWHGR